MKLYINHKLEICANEKGWPKEMCPADAKEADFERKRYAYELAKAKQESVPVITNYAGEMMDRIGSREFKPDTFIEFAGEVGYGWQWRPYDTSEWQATNEYYATIVRCGGNPCAQVRKVARLKPAKEPIRADLTEKRMDDHIEALTAPFPQNPQVSGVQGPWSLTPEEERVQMRRCCQDMNKENLELREKLATAEKRCKELEVLKQVTIDYLKKQDDKPFMASSSGSFTTHQLADEILNGTDTGINCLNGLLLLTIDQIARGKKTFNRPE